MLQKRKEKTEIHRIGEGPGAAAPCGYDGAEVYADHPDRILHIACPNCGANIVLTPDNKERSVLKT